MPTTRPAWRRALDGVEKRIAGPLDDVIQHEMTSVALSIGSRAIAGTKSKAERASRSVLHALNIPTASDLFVLLEHVSHIESELRALRASSQSRRSPTRPRGLPTPSPPEHDS